MIQQKLDCFLLTANISKIRSREIETCGKVDYDNQLSKEMLGSIMRIKRIEERIQTRLDYWIYGQLSNEPEHERFSSSIPQRVETKDEEAVKRIWGFGEETSAFARRRGPTEEGTPRKFDKPVSRSLSSAKSEQNRRRIKPWRTDKTSHKEDSISMFAYDPKSRLEVDDSLSGGAILRRNMFSKFGTISSRKLKMFFSRDSNDQDDTKSRKSVKSENPQRLSNISKDRFAPFLMKIRKKDKRNSELSTNESSSTEIAYEKKLRARPKSITSPLIDLDDVVVFPKIGNLDLGASFPSDDENKRKTFRERLRTMPVFYAPSSTQGHLKVFES